MRWTRTQKNSNRGEHPGRGVIVDQAELPVYLRIAGKAKHLRDLGMSDRAIARALGVSDKTVARAAGATGPLAPGISRTKEVS